MPVGQTVHYRLKRVGFRVFYKSQRNTHMLWKDRDGRMHSTTNLLPQTNTDDFIENVQECAKITGNLNLFEEMFGEDPYNEKGQDSAFMDDNYGG